MKKALFLAALTVLTGCSLKRIALRSTVDLLDEGSKAFHEESDTVLAKESMGSQLKLLEALLKNEPNNPALLRLTAQGFGGYAFLFLEETQPERAKTFYLRGRDYGLRLLTQNKSVASILTMSSSELEAALKGANASNVPALFWTGYNWAGWINLSRDSSEAVADLPKAALLMKRAHELSPQFYFAGPDLFFGSYFASRPKILGGDPEKAKTHFQWAQRINEGKFLMAYVLEARYYAVAVQDQELFQKLLLKVKDSPAGVLPNSRLVDEIAKEKAAVMLEKINDYF